MSIAILRVLEPWILEQNEIDAVLSLLKFREITAKRLLTLSFDAASNLDEIASMFNSGPAKI